MAALSKMRWTASTALSLILGFSLLPVQALAVDGEKATTEDAPLADMSAESNESYDDASSWRFRNGNPVAIDEGAEAESAEEDRGVSTFSIVAHPGVTWPTNIIQPPNATGLGIDVSYHNGVINWTAVKRAGVDFAIIRCGYGKNLKKQDDQQWLNNVRGARANGIQIGVYLYSYASTVEGAIEEAEHALRTLREAGLSPDDLKYPVYYDLEEAVMESSKKAPLLAGMAYAFCSTISRAGYTPAIYSNTNWYTNYLTYPVFKGWGKWVAQYNKTCTYKGAYQMWQFTSDGRVANAMSGNGGRTDLNFDLNNSYGKLANNSIGFKMESGNMFYCTSSGVRAKGWQSIDGKTYYFDDNGAMVTGEQPGIKSANGSPLTFGAGGELEGYWAQVNGAWYLRNQNDRNKTGWQYMRNNWYYLNGSTGVMQTGWYLQNNKSWYWLDPDSGAMRYGWVEVDGNKYYLSPRTGIMVTGTQTIGGKEYTFDSSGALLPEGYTATGVKWVFNGGKWYLQSSGKNLTGWQEVGGTWYYLHGSGAMATGWQSIGGSWYYLHPDSGAMATGWVNVGGTWYLLAGSGAMLTGWQKVGGTWYYLYGSGAMATGWVNVNGTWYLLAGSGAMLTGWQKVGGTWYYLWGSGAMATGWVNVGGTWYYLQPSGAMATGWQYINGAWYYLYGSGAMASNTWIGNYYVGDSGAMLTNQWIGRWHVNGAGLWDATR